MVQSSIHLPHKLLCCSDPAVVGVGLHSSQHIQSPHPAVNAAHIAREARAALRCSAPLMASRDAWSLERHRASPACRQGCMGRAHIDIPRLHGDAQLAVLHDRLLAVVAHLRQGGAVVWEGVRARACKDGEGVPGHDLGDLAQRQHRGAVHCVVDIEPAQA